MPETAPIGTASTVGPMTAAQKVLESGTLNSTDLRRLLTHPTMRGLAPASGRLSRTRFRRHLTWHGDDCQSGNCHTALGPIGDVAFADLGNVTGGPPRPVDLLLCANVDPDTRATFEVLEVGSALLRASSHIAPKDPELYGTLNAALILGHTPSHHPDLWSQLDTAAYGRTRPLTTLMEQVKPGALDGMLEWDRSLRERIDQLASAAPSPNPQGSDAGTWVVAGVRAPHDTSGSARTRDAIATWLLNAPLAGVVRDRRTTQPWGLWHLGTDTARELVCRTLAFTAGPGDLTDAKLETIRTAVTLYGADPNLSDMLFTEKLGAWRSSMEAATAAHLP